MVFDPMMQGASLSGGAQRLQVFCRTPGERFERVAAGEGPFHLEALDAWAFAVDEGRRLRFAEDREGTRWWNTKDEDLAKRVEELEARLRR